MTQPTDQLAPGLAQTEREVRAGVGSSKATADQRQAQAGAFIRENGHDAMHHTPVTGGQKAGG